LVFDAIIKNVDEWKAVVNAIGDIVEDVMFICNDDGVTFRGVDPAHVTLLDVTFPKSSFESFETQTSFFGLSVNELKMVLNTTNLGDKIHLQIYNSEHLHVTITGSLNMEYNIRLIERTEVNVPIPKITSTSKISINSETLTRIMSSLSKISEFVSIDCSTNKIEFSGRGDSGDAKINLDNTDPNLYDLNSSEMTSSSYGLEYMAKIIRDIGRSSKKVNIEFASQHPMHMHFEMPSAKVEYYLAPRVEV
jgi:proliferating cell nuclear antigen